MPVTGFYKYTLIVFAATFQTKQGYCIYHPKVDDKIYLSQYIKFQAYIYIKSKHMTHVSWSIWELFLCNSTQFAHWKFLQKNYVGEEQGIEALDNCDPEPEHRLLYQVVNLDWGGGRVCGAKPHDMFFASCFVVKNKHL